MIVLVHAKCAINGNNLIKLSCDDSSLQSSHIHLIVMCFSVVYIATKQIDLWDTIRAPIQYKDVLPV